VGGRSYGVKSYIEFAQVWMEGEDGGSGEGGGEGCDGALGGYY